MIVTALAAVIVEEYNVRSQPVVYAASVEEVVEPKEIQIKVVIDWSESRIEQEIREVFPENPNTMIAIAKCENGWNGHRGYVAEQQSQHTLSYGQERSFGIFQIHEPDWHHVAIELGYEKYQTDPYDNIHMARHIYDVQGITAWTCFNENLYQKYL